MTPLRAAAFAVLLPLAAASAQQPPAPVAPGGRISGRVVTADTGLPLAGAAVSLRSTRLAAPDGLPVAAESIAGADGSFAFDDVPGGSFLLRVTRAGFFATGPPTLNLPERQRASVTLRMYRGGAITGRVAGQFGEPVAGLRMQAQRYEYLEDGSRAAVPSGIADVTDDRGEFRVYGLPAGDYIVVASGRSVAGAPPDGFAGPVENAPTYYPGTLNAVEAQIISLGRGQETSVQFTLLTGRVARISGRLVSSSGQPMTGLMTTLASVTGTSATNAPAMTAADGAFEFTGVTPGDYWLSAQGLNRLNGALEAGSVKLTVGSDDITGLALLMRRGATLRGTVVFDGPRPNRPFPIEVAFADGRRGPFGTAAAGGFINPGPDGKFEVRGITGRVFFASQSPDWTVTSVSGAGPNALDGFETGNRDDVNGIRITVSDRLTQVSGRVTGGRGEAMAGYLVLLQRLGERLPRDFGSRSLRTDDAGRFDARGLRPGSYVAAAVDDLDAGQQFSPDFQALLRERGHRFSLGDGESVVLDLTPASGLR